MTRAARAPLWIGLLTALHLPGPLTAQINTEAMRRDEVPDGVHETLELDATLLSGNSDFFRGTAGLRIDWRARDRYLFGVVRYERGIEDDRDFVDKGFIHLRGIHRRTDRLSVEFFAQKEFDDFILIRDRTLLGGGFRIDLLGGRRMPRPAGVEAPPGVDPDASTPRRAPSIRLSAGIGAMWESEDLDTEPRTATRFLRATNYLSLHWIADDRLRLGAVVYYQVRYRDAGDARILLDAGLEFDLTRAVAFRAALGLRYDHEPPPGIVRHDVELTNGLRIAF